MESSHKQTIIEAAKKLGVLRPRDLDRYRIPREALRRLCHQGYLERVGRGLYRLPNISISEHYSLAEVSKRVPNGVICLLSALRFHDLTSQNPFEVWLAIDRKARIPKVEYPSLHIVRFSASALSEGVEQHIVDGVSLSVYNPAKTISDCFKYRNKIGLDVALEALNACWKSRRCSMDELWHFAKICRVQNVMRPYLEMLS